jgi:hypothetical protein
LPVEIPNAALIPDLFIKGETLRSSLLVLSAGLLFGCSSTPQKQASNTPHPVSRDVASVYQTTFDAIGYIGIADKEAATQCVDVGADVKNVNKRIYDCVTSVPVSIQVKDGHDEHTSSGVTNYAFNGIKSYHNLADPDDAEGKKEVSGIQSDMLKAMEERFTWVREGCTGTNVYVSTDKESDMITIQGGYYWGWKKCAFQKTLKNWGDGVVFYYNKAMKKGGEAVDTTVASGSDAYDKYVVENYTEMQRLKNKALHATADKIEEIAKNTAGAIRPDSKNQ